jgi:polar amino acid transport system substrate-binding protein
MNMDSIMKKYIYFLLMALPWILSGCNEDKLTSKLVFAVSAEYPPFEYYENGKITGFDIELAQLIAKELGKEAVFKDMQFSTILAALQSHSVDSAISTLTMTDERQKRFEFSIPYYTETLAVVFLKEKPVFDAAHLSQKKIACQLGSTMEIWLKKHVLDAEIISFDSSNQIIEALKAGHVDVALVDGIQGAIFSQKNIALSYTLIGKSDEGYGIAFPKESPLKDQVNYALKILQENGTLQELQKKWLVSTKWTH